MPAPESPLSVSRGRLFSNLTLNEDSPAPQTDSTLINDKLFCLMPLWLGTVLEIWHKRAYRGGDLVGGIGELGSAETLKYDISTP